MFVHSKSRTNFSALPVLKCTHVFSLVLSTVCLEMYTYVFVCLYPQINMKM